MKRQIIFKWLLLVLMVVAPGMSTLVAQGDDPLMFATTEEITGGKLVYSVTIDGKLYKSDPINSDEADEDPLYELHEIANAASSDSGAQLGNLLAVVQADYQFVEVSESGAGEPVYFQVLETHTAFDENSVEVASYTVEPEAQLLGMVSIVAQSPTTPPGGGTGSGGGTTEDNTQTEQEVVALIYTADDVTVQVPLSATEEENQAAKQNAFASLHSQIGEDYMFYEVGTVPWEEGTEVTYEFYLGTNSYFDFAIPVYETVLERVTVSVQEEDGKTVVCSAPKYHGGSDMELIGHFGLWYDLCQVTDSKSAPNADNPDGCETCAACETSCPSDAEASSIEITIPMSRGSFEGGAGSLYIHQMDPGAHLYDPGILVNHAGMGSHVIRDAQHRIRQVATYNQLLDIQINGPQRFSVTTYPRPKELELGENGLYPVPAAAAALRVVEFSNPNPDSEEHNQLQFTETLNGAKEDKIFNYDPETGIWSLTELEGELVKTSLRVFDEEKKQITQIKSVSGKDGAEKRTHSQTYQDFPFGRRLVKSVQDPGGEALTDIYKYQNDAAKGGFGHLEEVIKADGSWTRYEYNERGVRIGVVTPFKDSPVGSPTDQAQVSRQRKRRLEIDEDFFHPKAKLTETTKEVFGVLTKRTYSVSSYANDGSKIQVTERAHSPEAEYGDPKNLRSVSYYYSDDKREHGYAAGKLRQSITPDGRSTTYDYARGRYMGVAAMPGDFEELKDGDDVMTTRIEGRVDHPDGIVGKTTKSVSIANIYGKGLLQTSYLKTEDGWAELSWSGTEYDFQGRRVLARNQTGVTGEWRYAKCCNQVEWERDANGQVTTYQYDKFDRVKMHAQRTPGRQAIETWYTYNVHGQTIETRVTAGDLAQVTKRSYDNMGRLESSIDAAGLETRYSYDITGRKNTTILPGGATRVTETYLDGRQKSTTGTSVVAQFQNYGVNPETAETWTETRQARADSPRWSRSYSNFLGQGSRSERPGYGDSVVLSNHQEYDDAGRAVASSSTVQLANGEIETFGAASLTQFNEIGEIELSGQDIDGDQQLQAASSDRLSKSESEVKKLEDGNYWRISKSWSFPRENDGTPVYLGETRQRITGYNLISHGEDGELGQLVSESISIQPSTKNEEPRTTTKTYRNRETATTTTFTRADGVETVQVSQGGLVQKQITKPIRDSAPLRAIQVAFEYDSLGRRIAVVDPRTGTSRTEYDKQTGRLLAEVDAAENRTEYRYYAADEPNAGQLKTVINASKKKQHVAYNARGQKNATWGESDYPLSYEYDDYGQLVKLITFQQNPDSSAPNRAALLGSVNANQQTKWIYDEATGLLNRKEYADGNGTDYEYTPSGQLLERKWARGDKSVYAYNDATGQIDKVENISVDQRKSAVEYSYTRTGAIQEIIQQLPGTEAHPEAEVVKYSYVHNEFGKVIEERFERSNQEPGTKNQEHVVRRSYTALGQPATMVFDCLECEVPHPVNYEWDALGRLAAVESDLAGRFQYAYHADSPNLLTSMTSPVHQVAYRYENARNLITEVQNVALGEDRRTKFQLRSNEAPAESEPASTQPAAEPRTVSHYHYTNDALGRRVARHQHGEAFADQPRRIEYAYNDRSEVTGANYYSEPQGEAASRRPEPESTFAYEYDAIGNRKSAAAEVSGESWTLSSHQIEYQANAINQYEEISVPSEPSVVPSYDIDGNLTGDTSFQYQWNAQNRLAAVETPDGLERHEYQYDYIGRRIAKRSYTRAAETENWKLNTENFFAYDGWNLISEITQSPGHQVTQSHFVWGRDLSGSMQGAGGVGGLLAISHSENSDFHNPTFAFPLYDANGNITQLIAADGQLGAMYEYSPFGEQLKAEGKLTPINPIGFSTKYDDPETRMLYYGFRYYNASAGRWASRDPIGERGGMNVFAMLMNTSVNMVDYLGQAEAPNQNAGPYVGDWGDPDSIPNNEGNDIANIHISSTAKTLCEKGEKGRITVEILVVVHVNQDHDNPIYGPHAQHWILNGGTMAQTFADVTVQGRNGHYEFTPTADFPNELPEPWDDNSIFNDRNTPAAKSSFEIELTECPEALQQGTEIFSINDRTGAGGAGSGREPRGAKTYRIDWNYKCNNEGPGLEIPFEYFIWEGD